MFAVAGLPGRRDPPHREREDSSGHGEHPDEHEDHEVAAGPVKPGSLADPEDAEARQHDAHGQLHRVLRDFRKLARHEIADGADDDHSGTGRSRGERQMTRARPEGDHDEHDLHALEEDALESDGETGGVTASVASTTRPRRCRWSPSSPVREVRNRLRVDRVLVVQRLVTARPQHRLPQPVEAEHEQEGADDHAQDVDRDTSRASGTPTAMTSAASTSAATTVPSSAERQPRVTPAAATIVSASTISTALAPNTARASTTVEVVIVTSPQRLTARRAYRRRSRSNRAAGTTC